MKTTNAQGSRRLTWWIIGCLGFTCLVLCIGIVIAVVYYYPLIQQRGFSLGVIETQVMLTLEATPLEAQEQQPTDTQPAPTQEIFEAQPTSEPPPSVNYEGISFSYTPAIAQSSLTEKIPAVSGDPANAFPGEIHPEYIQFKIQGYPLKGTFHEPRINVYPAFEYGSLDPAVAQKILELKSILEQKPAQVENLPFLPIFNAAQFMQAQIKYLDFKNGSGVRFLTQYGQAFWPVNNHDLFYTFQGMTSDGKWYIAAIMPISNPMLPITGDAVPGGDFEAFANNFENYITDMELQLDAQPDSSYLPPLNLLDEMFVSFKIQK